VNERLRQPRLPESLARILAAHPEEIVLVLEPQNRPASSTVVLMLVAGMLPVILVLLVSQGSWTGSLVLLLYLGLLGLLWQGLQRGPTDIVLTREGVHLFWRWFSRVRHRVLPLDAIASAEASVHAIQLTTMDGKRLKVPVTFDHKYGVAGLFVVFWNGTTTPFDEQRSRPNHVKALKEVLDELLRGRAMS